MVSSRIVAHGILASSILLFAFGIFLAFGSVVHAPAERVPSWQAVRYKSNMTYRIGAVIETFGFEKTLAPDDTMILSIRNLGDVPVVMRHIYINEVYHELIWHDSYVFDSSSRFTRGRAIPSDGFGIIRVKPLPTDENPKDHVYNMVISSNIGALRGRFSTGDTVHRDRTSWQPWLGGAFVAFAAFTVSIHYYHKYSDAEGQNLILR